MANSLRSSNNWGGVLFDTVFLFMVSLLYMANTRFPRYNRHQESVGLLVLRRTKLTGGLLLFKEEGL